LTVWLVTAEAALDGEIGFINITLWAPSSQEAIERVRAYFHRYDWQLVSVERAIEADSARDYGEELNRLIEETLGNRNFIRLGTYFTYPPN
jgi:hypothetical protein